MSWFENQVTYSKLKDEETLTEAYVNIAGAITGDRLRQAWHNRQYSAKTALEDICRYYRIRPREVPASIRDLNGQLDYALQPCGIMRRTVKLKGGWYRDAIGAMLGTRKEDGSPIALIPGKMGGYTFRDPDSGKWVRIRRKNADLLDGEAVVFYRPFPLRSITVRDLIDYMRTNLDFGDIFWYLFSLASVTVLGLLIPKLTNILFSQVTVSGSVRLLLGVILFMVCQTITVQLVSGIQKLLLAKINMKLELSVRSASVMRLFSMPAEFFRRYSSGELNQHVEYLNQMCGMIVSALFSTGLTGVFSLVYIFQIVRYSPALALPAVLITLATLLLSFAMVLANGKVSKQRMDVTAREHGMVYSIISGIQKIRLCGAEKRAFARWGNLYAQEAKITYAPPVLVRFGSVMVTAIGTIGMVALYFASVRNGVSAADYYTFSSAYAYVSAAFVSLAGMAQSFASIRSVLQIVRPLMETPPELAEEKEIVTRLSGNIELNHLFFRYPDSDITVLKDISLKINPGQYVAIVGESGCGKTTLLRILLGFEKPQKGAVYYDGKNMDTLDLKSLRRKIGVVMQSGKLMWGDIFSNITVSAPWLTLEDAWEAAEIAGIADDIREMPMGMHTIIQEGSGGISGGQRQRIMIARAVAPKPKILFLDEATSALDNITQKKVCEAMDKMKCTRIVIAHRLSTIRQCDRILLLKDGRVAEDGSYDELIARNGLFAELVKRQMVTPE